jgi:cation transport ATPase
VEINMVHSIKIENIDAGGGVVPSVSPERVTIPVTGMTCAACQSFIQRTLTSQAGVRDASVNLMMNNATVMFDPGVTSTATLVDTIRSTGYGAELPVLHTSVLTEQEEHDAEQLSEYRQLRLKATVSLIAGFFAMVLSMPDLDLPQAEEFESQTGYGVVGIVEGEVTLIGNPALMKRYSVATDSLHAAAERIAEEGKTPLWIAIGGRLAGIIAVADMIKPTSIHAIRQMHAEGLRVVMLTGDNEHTARAIAREAGVDEVIADVLPAGKMDAIKSLQGEHRVVAMVGDGVNDAPALAQADVGLTMASGSDIAMEAGDVTLMRSDLTGVAAAIALSRATMRVMRQNLFWAFIYNVIGIPLAAGALYPVFGLLLSPVIASAAMALSSFSVVTNSLRLRQLKLA